MRKAAQMDRDEWKFLAVGEKGRHRYEVKEHSFAWAERCCRQILRHNEVFEVARIEDRKGNTLKVIRREWL